MVQLSHPFVTTGNTIPLFIRTFVSKGMSLLLNMLSRLAIVFLPREQVSFNFMAAVTVHSDVGVQKKYSLLLFPLFPYLCAVK